LQRERNGLERPFSSITVLIIPVRELRMDRRWSHDTCIESLRKPHGGFQDSNGVHSNFYLGISWGPGKTGLVQFGKLGAECRSASRDCEQIQAEDSDCLGTSHLITLFHDLVSNPARKLF